MGVFWQPLATDSFIGIDPSKHLALTAYRKTSNCPLASPLPSAVILATMTPKPTLAELEDLMAHAEGHANFLMRQNGRVPPMLYVATPKGVLVYVVSGRKLSISEAARDVEGGREAVDG